ncbi:hypothetical protein [Thermomonospora umbrina]|uniref:Uncharacterized protein n=1 Tax=Thermomonospora umbrina TaxID=111806 RepID=A0A3D9SUD7_9ACTN|nr:hypothetical protein [Thermomonospora umbrina]REE99217.1 hypothetical protein DFJ69_4725 [Thermomonospora umbrina]
MTAITHAGAARPRNLRLIVCWLTIAACVPYLTLKVLWLSGGTVGWIDPADAEGSALYTANAITLVMDMIAVVVALALTYGWGRRLPAWLVLTPIWVAAGLLAPIVVAALPAMAIEAAVGSSGSAQPDMGLETWVFVMVYTGFTLQGIGLMAAFALYARDRWPDVFRTRTAALPKGPTASLQSLMVVTAAVLAVPYVVVHGYWALGGDAGISDDMLDDRSTASYVVAGVWGAMAVVGVLGLLALVFRRGSGRLLGPLTAAWVGAGSMFCQSLYQMLVLIGRPGELGGEGTALGGYTLLAGLISGLILALAGAVLLAERPQRPAGCSPRS